MFITDTELCIQLSHWLGLFPPNPRWPGSLPKSIKTKNEEMLRKSVIYLLSSPTVNSLSVCCEPRWHIRLAATASAPAALGMSVCVKGEDLALKLDQKVLQPGERHRTAETGTGEVPRRISQTTPFDVRLTSESTLIDGCSQSESLWAISASK